MGKVWRESFKGAGSFYLVARFRLIIVLQYDLSYKRRVWLYIV